MKKRPWGEFWQIYNTMQFCFLPVAGSDVTLLYKSQKKIDKNNTISSHVKISMISLISSLSLKLYLNLLGYHRNIFGSSSKVFGNLQTSLENLKNSRKMFGSVRLAFGTILENLLKSSESGRKSSENHQKCRVYIIKRT